MKLTGEFAAKLGEIESCCRLYAFHFSLVRRRVFASPSIENTK